jgi:hypothetical protein
MEFGKKGQQTMGMPFGIIFAIFLIVIFVVIAFIAVGFFLDTGRSAGVGLFYRDLQDAVDQAWNGQAGEFSFEIDLPKNIDEVCFGNLSDTITNVDSKYNQILNYDVYDANTFLVPPENAQNMQWKLIKHINISKITENQNPYCVPADGKLRIKKGFYDRLVTIE